MSAAEAHYARRRDDSKALAAALSSRSSAVSLARVLAFLGVVGFGLAARFSSLGSAAGALAGVSGLVFVALIFVHDRVLARLRRAEGSIAWAEEGIRRLAGDFAQEPRAGEPKAEDTHAYAGDLDVFGRGGILQSLDTTRTREARALLGKWLAAPAAAEEIRSRQSAARELAEKTDLREALAVEGGIVAEEPPSLAPLLAWARNGTGLTANAATQLLALVLPAVTIALIVFGGRLPIPRATWVFTLVTQFLLASRFRGKLKPAIDAASEHHDGLARFSRMLQVIETARFGGEHLASLHGRIAEGPASVAIARLGRIVGFVDARRNEVFKLLVAPLLLWDLNCALALERWRTQFGRAMQAQLDALFRVEALAALGTRAYEQPGDAWPTIGTEIVLEAKGVAHPLIPAQKAVRNDVSFDATRSILLVTGSNMSGKSTLMRAIGSNLVLALAGAPVRAKSLVTSPFRVWTSMRVRDDLHAGVSHFFAELKRLKAVVDAADVATESEPVLFLLDEILHGTNSRERHLGARGIVRHLSKKHACGAVSTHDLALAALEQELAGRVRNVHFREQVEMVDGKETMTFDYVLREGLVTSSNALRLMRIVGLDVDVE
ncbi:MAG: MutS-related protein [Polyangiales bacterium]